MRIGRIGCPSCGHTETLGDLSRQTHELRRRLGGLFAKDPPSGTEPPRQDVCLACGTIYDPWVRREASRRRQEIERLQNALDRGA